MTGQGDELVVDFTCHFQKRINKNYNAKNRRQGLLSASRRQPDTQGQQTAKATNHKPESRKRKESTAPSNEHGSKAKKQKVQRELPVPSFPKKRVEKDYWPFKVDYNDHFETPLQAVQDIQPVLHLLCEKLKKPPNRLTAYDPFYCQGGIRRHWEHLGFENFIHRNRDFYADVTSGQVPTYDILVTNPPYSEDHKERILEFCLKSGKPWALLLPNYVATKAYLGQLLDSTSTPASQRPFFLTPAVRYNYEHPEGSGHAESPFFSIWYIGLGKHTEAIHGACRARLDSESVAATEKPKEGGGGNAGGGSGCGASGPGTVWGVSLARTVDGLRQAGAVPTARRLNPKQRARLKQQKLKAKQA